MKPFKKIKTESLGLALFLARFLVYLAAFIVLLTIPMGMYDRVLISPLFYISRALPVAIVILVISCLLASLVSIDSSIKERRE
ncbi:hypothetical protein JD504_08105 [Aeromonas hydrophila]|uniref:hypothetical protein n=1 Tax=Aeromonas hydrophila TaxID=644 RepID=UPI00191F5ADE|nr:hypothetical protein [Aeromonas hydrophila]MBL0670714.1 hypothetical protein [Aeromonas hydrophila]